MNIYLMQHGEAVDEPVDPARPLSAEGRQNVLRVAQHAARMGVGLSMVIHSGKLRARQSAELLAQVLGASVSEHAGLGPNDEVAGWDAQLIENMALVGHLPFLDRLAALLVSGDTQRPVLAWQNAGLVCLVRQASGWRLRWVLPPGLAG